MSSVVVMQIVVTRELTEDDDIVRVSSTEGVSIIDGIGMLGMAIDIWSRTNGLQDPAEGGRDG